MNHDIWWQHPIKKPDESAGQTALARQATLTKPPGSLGRLEDIAVDLAKMQGNARPDIKQPWITIFAGDHGVVDEGVSAFPQEVTQQMMLNFVSGGAAIAVLATQTGARLEVVDAGSLATEPIDGVIWGHAGTGTRNFCVEPAMSAEECALALDLGRQAVERALTGNADLFIGGEMGIGNTTAAAAVACALTGLKGADLAGPGTGLDKNGVAHKAAVINRGLERHASFLDSPDEILRRLGGFEIGALVGAFIACAQRGLPVLVDGFIASTAALTACRMNPGTRNWLLFGHTSAEPGHARILATLAARPFLQMEMRLGEGSGAATAIPLLRLACALHSGMATFAEAGVTKGE